MILGLADFENNLWSQIKNQDKVCRPQSITWQILVNWADNQNSARPTGGCREADGECEPDCEHAQVKQPGAPARAEVGWPGLKSIHNSGERRSCWI